MERLELIEKGAKAVAEKIQAGEAPDAFITQFYQYVADSLNKKVEAFTSPQTQQIVPADLQLKGAMVDEIKRIQIEHPKSLDGEFKYKRSPES